MRAREGSILTEGGESKSCIAISPLTGKRCRETGSHDVHFDGKKTRWYATQNDTCKSQPSLIVKGNYTM